MEASVETCFTLNPSENPSPIRTVSEFTLLKSGFNRRSDFWWLYLR
jgi:hypothetical protein